MKFIGQYIQDLIARFRSDVYLEDIDTGTIASGGNLGLDSNNKIVKASAGGISFDGSTANGVLTYKDSDEASVEATLTYDSEALTIGADDNGFATIQRLTHSDGNGGHLNLAGGKGTGTSKTGGDIHLYGGQSTGNVEGGSLKFSTSTSDGSSDANVNTVREVFEVDTAGNITMLGGTITNTGSNDDLLISCDGSMSFGLDRDNDETSQKFSFNNTTTEIASIDESGNLQVDGGITTGSTSFANSSGVIQVAGQTNITGVGTISTGTWQGTSIATTYTAAKVTSIVAGDGIDVSGATGDVTVTAEDASTTNPGVVELATTAETTTGTDTGRAVTPDGLKDGYQGSTNVVTLGTIGTGTWNATAIASAKMETATASAQGAVELATTGEADTGTDTSRAVTPAGLKSHVDARYAYQYISLSLNASTAADGDWMTASGNGIGNHTYNLDLGAGGTTAHNTDGSATTISLDKNKISGIIVPYDCTLVGFYAQTRASSNDQKALGIFTGTPIWNDYANINVYLRGYNAQDISAGPDTSYSLRPVQHSVLSINKSLSAGDCMWMAARSVGGGGGGCIASATIVLKTLIP